MSEPLTAGEEAALRERHWILPSRGGSDDIARLLATLDATRKLATPAGGVFWNETAHVVAPAIAPSSTLREKARLVAQWHGAIGSGPLEVLDAELADLAAAVRAEPDTLGVDRLARAILVAAQESDRRPITDGFEWYGSALELAEGVRDALATLDAG